MQNNVQAGILRVKDGRVVCPACKYKTSTEVRPYTRAKGLPVYCHRCKQTYIVDIDADQRCMASPRR